MEIKILDGHAATARMACEKFQEAWHALFRSCRWATGFQAPAFALAWYETYAATAEPVLVIAEDGHDLVGLLALAWDGGSYRLFNVGDHQAEYHAWIAADHLANAFIIEALSALSETFPRSSLSFRYLPPDAPTAWLDEAHPLRDSLSIRKVSRPLIRLIDDQQIETSLRKRSNRSRLNRLRKACGGELTSRVIGTEEELATVIDEIARHYDQRQSTLNGIRPFLDDADKKEFHLKLMRAGCLHAFTLHAGSSFVAAIISVKSGRCLSLGILAHAIDLAPCSPGKFGVLFMALAALRDDYDLIDLTPGGDWKDRFANDGDWVLEAKVWFDRRAMMKARLNEQAISSLKWLLRPCGPMPQKIRQLLAVSARRIKR
ncbi:MAG: GNAT family N-acetyltransferase [Pseudomonadota bacterium]